MNVLITGGAGLIGMALRPILLAAGHAVTAIDITDFGRLDPELLIQDFEDADGLDRLVGDGAIDAIVHCAAISGPMFARGEPLLIVESNITATARLLDLARRHGMRRFVFCSSISVYGNAGPMTLSENAPLHPTSIYGASKVAGEALVEGFAVEYGVDGVSLRIARVYGPYRRGDCHLRNAIHDAEAGRATEIPCDPSFAYHYVHVDDVADAIRAALEAETLPARAYNVSGPALTMPQIAEAARAVLPGARIRLVTGADDVADMQGAFDIGAIGRDLGWQPHLDIAKGVAAYRDAVRAGLAA